MSALVCDETQSAVLGKRIEDLSLQISLGVFIWKGIELPYPGASVSMHVRLVVNGMRTRAH